MRRTSLRDGFVLECDDYIRFVGLAQLASPVLLLGKMYKTQKALLHHPVTTFTSSSNLANDGRIGDREMGLRR